MIIYLKLLSFSYTSIKDIYSKNEYFSRELAIERDQILRYKKELSQLPHQLIFHCRVTNESCEEWNFLLKELNSKQIFRIIENNQHTKEEFHQVLLPLQYLLVCLCLFNNILILITYEKALKLFFFSNILCIICLSIYGEFFIKDRPSLSYTLIIALFIVLFTIFLLFKVFDTLLIIRHYRLFQENLKNLHQFHFD